MKRPIGEPQAAQVSPLQSLTQKQQPSAVETVHAARAEAARLAAERAFVAHVQALTERVGILESALRALQSCTVQQHANGRLHFPAGNRLTFELPGPYGIPSRWTIDVSKCTVAGPRPHSAAVPRPCSKELAVGTSGQQTGYAPGPTAPAGAPLGASVAGRTQSIAASNGIADPRRG